MRQGPTAIELEQQLDQLTARPARTRAAGDGYDGCNESGEVNVNSGWRLGRRMAGGSTNSWPGQTSIGLELAHDKPTWND